MGELDGRMTALRIKQMPNFSIRFAGADDFREPGDKIVGALLHHHPTVGAEDFDRTTQVGVLMLKQVTGEIVKIALDKGQLATEVNNAMAIAKFAMHPFARAMVKVTYVGTHNRGHKMYEVGVGFATNAHGYDQVFGYSQYGIPERIEDNG